MNGESSSPGKDRIDTPTGSVGSLLDVLKGPRARIMAAALALLTAAPACGGEDKNVYADAEEQPEPPAVCDTAERQTVTAPQPENVYADAIVDNRMRVHFTIPEFDEECKLPLRIRCIGTLWTGADEGASFGQPPANNAVARALPPYEDEGFEVWDTGDTSVSVEVPEGQRVVDFRLEVTDGQGERFVTNPVIVE